MLSIREYLCHELLDIYVYTMSDVIWKLADTVSVMLRHKTKEQ